jgi:hypothetical protein
MQQDTLYANLHGCVSHFVVVSLVLVSFKIHSFQISFLVFHAVNLDVDSALRVLVLGI